MIRLTNILLAFRLCFFASTLLLPSYLHGQLINFSKQDLIDYTAQNPFERFPDGRPKVPDDLIERARGVSLEEIWAILPKKGFNNQYADGFQVLHPGKKLVGRVVTAQFMPVRPDLDEIASKKAKERGIPILKNQMV